MSRNGFLLFAVLAAAPLGCARNARLPGASPAFMLGDYDDDYGGRHTVSQARWLQHPNSIYHIVYWDVERGYLIAQNDSANPSSRGLWTRIDFIPLKDMAPWTRAFCFSAYRAPSRTAAESTLVAVPSTPRTGCNGHPFTRLKNRPK